MIYSLFADFYPLIHNQHVKNVENLHFKNHIHKFLSTIPKTFYIFIDKTICILKQVVIKNQAAKTIYR